MAGRTVGWVHGFAVVVLCLIQFVDVLGVTSATTAIPAIVAGLGAGEAAAGPLATTYAMFFGGLLVVGARLGDKFGHRRVLGVGLLGFVAVSLVGGLAGSLGQVLIARALQGVSAAISVPSALRLLLHVASDEGARRSALAAWSAAGAAAGAAGFVIGGALVEAWDWRAVFWMNAPVGVLLMMGLLLVVPALPGDRAMAGLDLIGAAFLVAATMLVVAGASGIEQGGSRLAGAVTILAGLGVGAAFALRMRHAVAPLIPPGALRSVNLRHGTMLSFVNTATTSSSAVLATLHLQDTLGLSAVIAGLTLMAFSVLVVVGSTLAKPLLARFTPRGLASGGIAMIALSNLTLVLTGTTWAGTGIAMGVGGLGIGIASVAATKLGTDVPNHIASSASGILNTGAQLGTALGTALVVMIATLTSNTGGWAAALVLAAATALWAYRARAGPIDDPPARKSTR